MSQVFLKVLNMSISAGWLILAVLVLRFALKGAPKWTRLLLWAIVALRLVCPVSIQSSLSLMPSNETIPLDIAMEAEPAINSGIQVIDRVAGQVLEAAAPDPSASANPLQIMTAVAANIWLLGMVMMLIHTAVSYWRLRQRVSTAVLYRDNVFQSENVTSPFVLGIVRPRIYLPFAMETADMDRVIAHEQAHISRRDHWWKPLGYLLLAVHWFNLLVWLAYVMLCRDIELACDERVIKDLGSSEKADYSQTLVRLGVSGRGLAVCPLAFGEVGVKQRVKAVLNYKKPRFWVMAAALLVIAAAAVCFLTDPAGEKGVLMEAKVLEINNGTMLIQEVNDPNSRITVSVEHMKSSPEPQPGDILAVRYNGDIMETDPARLGEVYSIWVIQQANETEKYYLNIQTNGVTLIETSIPGASGGCMNADESPFKEGEQVWLELLDGVKDLRGLSITAWARGEAVYELNILEDASDEEIVAIIGGDAWFMAPTTAEVAE